MGWTTWILAGSLLGQAAPSEPTPAPRYPVTAGAPSAAPPAAAPSTAPPSTAPPSTAAPPTAAPPLDVPPVAVPEPPGAIMVPREAPAATPAAPNPAARHHHEHAQPPREPVPPTEPATRNPPHEESRDAAAGGAREAKSNSAALLSSLLALPEEMKPVGRWLPLVEVLSAGFDRPRQIELTQTYWKLSVAAAQVRVAWDERRLWSQLRPLVSASSTQRFGTELIDDYESQLATSQARLQDAELKLLAAQQELADKMRLPLGSPLPLPSDAPHLGTYTTRYEQIYSGSPPPPHARVIDRALPLRRELIEAHATAASAAFDAADAATDGTQVGGLSWTAIVAAVENSTRQRRSFLAAVRQYNDDIATYALSIPREPLSTAGLVGMLIKVETPIGAPLALQPPPSEELPGAVNPTTFNAPLPMTDAARSGRSQEPTLARPRAVTAPAASAPPVGPTAVIAIPTELNGPPATAPTEPRAASATEFGPVEARKLPLNAEPVGFYSALAELTPAKRAQELANLLNWDRQLPEDVGTPISLGDCLGAVSEGERRSILAAYWRTRQSAAGYQLVHQELEQLDALGQAALRLRQQPAGPVSMLLLRHARLALKAELIETRLTLLVDQFALTQAARRPLDGKWLLPSTAPHGGGYRMKPDAQPLAVADATAFRRAAAMIPTMHQTLEQRAAAVVTADAVRALEVGRFETGQQGIETLLAAVSRQTDETREFLTTLTQYNLEIADYALAVLPPQTPAAGVAASLVLRPTEQPMP